MKPSASPSQPAGAERLSDDECDVIAARFVAFASLPPSPDAAELRDKVRDICRRHSTPDGALHFASICTAADAEALFGLHTSNALHSLSPSKSLAAP